MVITKLNEELLPYFVFLIDGIAEHLDNDIEIGKIFKVVREQEISCSWHAVQRSFQLREYLKHEEALSMPIHLPKKNTLDALTEFLYGSGYIFRNLIDNSEAINVSNEEVLKHYSEHLPHKKAIERVFKTKNEKEHLINGQKQILADFKDDFQNLEDLSITLSKLGVELEEKLKRLRTEINNDIKLRNTIIERLDMRISELERKSKRVSLFRGLFGVLGAFLVSVNYNENAIEEFIDDFLESYDEGFADDFLDGLT